MNLPDINWIANPRRECADCKSAQAQIMRGEEYEKKSERGQEYPKKKPNYETRKAMKDVELLKGTKVRNSQDLFSKLRIKTRSKEHQ